jgi:hypothetical protein
VINIEKTSKEILPLTMFHGIASNDTLVTALHVLFFSGAKKFLEGDVISGDKM